MPTPNVHHRLTAEQRDTADVVAFWLAMAGIAALAVGLIGASFAVSHWLALAVAGGEAVAVGAFVKWVTS